MKLILTRHGETEENKTGIFQGHLPGKLSLNGMEQARKVAVRLKEEKLDFIYSSDLERAANTAKEIARYHPNTPIEFVEKLRERNLGDLQGKKKSEIYSYLHEGLIPLRPKGGESIEEVYSRAESFLFEILTKHKKDSVLFVCHGGIGKALVAIITGKTYLELKTIENLHNTSISIFEIEDNLNYTTLCYNCIKHLE